MKISDGVCRNALMPGGVDATREPKLRRRYGECTNEIREYSHLRASLLAACSTVLVSSSGIAMTWVAEEAVSSSMEQLPAYRYRDLLFLLKRYHRRVSLWSMKSLVWRVISKIATRWAPVRR